MIENIVLINLIEKAEKMNAEGIYISKNSKCEIYYKKGDKQSPSQNFSLKEYESLLEYLNGKTYVSLKHEGKSVKIGYFVEDERELIFIRLER